MQLGLTVHQVPWRAPLRTARSVASPPRPLVLVRLETAEGLVGHGEAAPLHHYDGVTLSAVLEALHRYAPVLAAADGESAAGLLAACAQVCALPQALAAVDLALWDLAGQRAGQPVWRLLGAGAPPAVRVNAVIGAVDPAAAGAEAGAACAAGYDTVKVKIAAGADLRRVMAVRAAIGPERALRVDANGGWTDAGTAVAEIERLSGANLEFVEEPVPGAAGLAAVAERVEVPVFADESAPGLLAHPGEHRAVAGVCLKIAAAGGISGLLAQARQARDSGREIVIASTLDGPLGIAAALHAAAAAGAERACGLATLGRFAAPNPLPVRAGRLSPPEGAGLGAGLSAWYARHGT